VGVPLESIPGFIKRLEAMYQKTTGEPVKKSPGAGPKATIAKGGKAAKEDKAKEGKPKEKKEKKEKEPPAPKPTMEDLDAELASYTAQRGSEPAEEAPAAAE
jgi:hypothetical protein